MGGETGDTASGGRKRRPNEVDTGLSVVLVSIISSRERRAGGRQKGRLGLTSDECARAGSETARGRNGRDCERAAQRKAECGRYKLVGRLNVGKILLQAGNHLVLVRLVDGCGNGASLVKMDI